MGPTAECYQRTKQRLLLHAAGLPDDFPIAATPGWKLLELLAHVTGVAADVSAKNVDHYAQDGWTAHQVESRRGRSRHEILEEWERATPELTAILDDPTAAGLDEMYAWAPVSDLVIHREDLLESDGRLARLEEEELAITWAGRLETLGLQLALADLPPLGLRSAAGDQWLVGDGEAETTVTADFDDLRRSLQGRRTRQVVRAFDWQGDPEPYLPLWTGFTFSWPEDRS